ncbi:MAG TPA: amidohydrolase family protein, partial [Rhodopila sp.]|nr:amidohydrolase family protein [Rhodopila sp.]
MTPDVPASAPWCMAAEPDTRRPRIVMPPGACDTHAHVCGPFSTYEYAAERLYTPPDATWPMYRRMLDTLGVERAVLTQPSVYGTDNTALVDALAVGGKAVRGVAVVEPSIDDAALRALDAAGVRGVRINIVDRRENRNVLVLDELMPLARRIAPLGWHIEFLLQADAVPDLAETCAKLPVPVVLGHLGYVHADKGGAANPGFQALLRWLGAGQCWVKLTGPYRISAEEVPYGDVTPMAQALVAAAPERLLWGTDWPHVMMKKRMPNDADIADLLLDWVPTAHRQAIL